MANEEKYETKNPIEKDRILIFTRIQCLTVTKKTLLCVWTIILKVEPNITLFFLLSQEDTWNFYTWKFHSSSS